MPSRESDVEGGPGRGRAGAHRRRTGRSRPGPAAGFALVVVVWGLGLVTLLGTMAIVGARNRARDTGDLAAIAQAAADAESAVDLGILRALAGDPPLRRPVPLGCNLPDGSAVRILVSREAGKVDLNASPLPLLARLFAGLTRDPARGAAVARAIVAFRTPGDDGLAPGQAAVPRADGFPDGPKRAPFVTVLELDQVPGVPPDLVAAALPFVTVMAGSPEPDPDAAAPALLALLGLRPPDAARAGELPGAVASSGPVTVRAVARTLRGAVAVREALVDVGAGGSPYRIAEWRRGTPAPDEASATDPGAAPPCLRPDR